MPDDTDQGRSGEGGDGRAPDVPVPVAGVDPAEWGRLVDRGRHGGEVHADQVSHVLRHVELSEAVLTAVHDAMDRAGIRIDDAVEHHDVHDDEPDHDDDHHDEVARDDEPEDLADGSVDGRGVVVGHDAEARDDGAGGRDGVDGGRGGGRAEAVAGREGADGTHVRAGVDGSHGRAGVDGSGAGSDLGRDGTAEGHGDDGRGGAIGRDDVERDVRGDDEDRADGDRGDHDHDDLGELPADGSGEVLGGAPAAAHGGREHGDADEQLLSRRRQRRTRKRGPRAEGGSADAVRMYLREIGQVDLLTVDDERRLAQLIEEGKLAAERIDEANEAGEPIEGAESRTLLRAVNRGERAKSELTQANLRLVVSIAKRYSGRGMQLLDLVQEGNLGLMRAVDKFDYTKGFKFSTYATWWIRQAITRSIADQARTIRIPVHMVEHMNRVTRAKRTMHQELEREPTIDELAHRVQLEPERVRELLRISQDPLSLDSPVGEEDESNLGDFIQDESADSPADAATKVMLSSAVGEVLGELSEREQEIVRLRFGLDGGRARTLEEVGKEFGVTRERIRQIEAKTLAKLRHPQRSQRLREFLEVE